jgi:hypothetical protein
MKPKRGDVNLFKAAEKQVGGILLLRARSEGTSLRVRV